MSKFGRSYRLTIDMADGSGAIVVEPPFTIQFSVERSISSNMNTMLLIIYNLGGVTRNSIFQDFFITDVNRNVTLQAGYGDNLSTIFTGNMTQVFSARQGANIITTIHAFDGGFDTESTLSARTMAAGSSIKDVLSSLIGDFPNLNQGNVGDIPGTFKRPVVLDGNTFDLIKRYSNNRSYIDLQQVHILQPDEVIDGIIPVLNSESGLLETPRRENAFLTADMLFEPQILMSQVIDLEGTVQPIFNGQYKVIGIKHQGIISEAVGGQCVTSLDLLLGSEYFGRFKNVSAPPQE